MHSSARRVVLPLLLAVGACAQPPTDPASRAAQRTAALSTYALATDGTDGRPTVDAEYALVQLRGDPLSTSSKTRPPPGKKIDFDASTVKAYRAQLSALRNDFKAWLHKNAPSAKVTGEFDTSLNAVAVKLNGVPLAAIAAAPQAIRAEYEGLYYPVSDVSTDPDLAVITALQAWGGASGAPGAGEGVKVAIVDTGIDVTHPCFGDDGYDVKEKQLGDTTFTNHKVIVAKVFNNKVPSRGYTAEAVQDHGTHVAGTVACNYGTPATVDGVTIPHAISGVAPAALLGNYNIFPGDAINARSEDILNALEAAYADGFDVANMSLGGGAQGIQDLLSVAVDDLDRAGMVVAVAAGNSGPGHYTVESPGSAARALSAGASTVGHFVGAVITAGAGGAVKAEAVAGEFGKLDQDVTAPLAPVFASAGSTTLSAACSPLSVDLTGKIAIIERGTCTFAAKIRYAQAAGAAVVIVANNVNGDGIAMGSDGTPDQPTVPAYMVSSTAGAALKGVAGPATVTGALQYLVTGNDDIMAAFSGQGPTDVDFRIKPDVVAPGVNVLSSIPHQFCVAPPCFAFFQGTSMATPHLAGSAAFVHGKHPAWSAAQVRSAIVNTATQGTLKVYQGAGRAVDVNLVGAGREDLVSANAARIALDPVSISFGAVPSGSGQTRTFDVVVSDLTGSGGTYALAIADASTNGVEFSVRPSTLTVAPNGSARMTITMAAQKGAATGDDQAMLRLTAGGTEVAHAAVYAFVK